MANNTPALYTLLYFQELHPSSTANNVGSSGEKNWHEVIPEPLDSLPFLRLFFYFILGNLYTTNIKGPSFSSWYFLSQIPSLPLKACEHYRSAPKLVFFKKKNTLNSGASNTTFHLLGSQNMLKHIAYTPHKASVIYQVFIPASPEFSKSTSK